MKAESTIRRMRTQLERWLEYKADCSAPSFNEISTAACALQWVLYDRCDWTPMTMAQQLADRDSSREAAEAAKEDE